MKRKFLMMGVVLLAICVTISAVSADDGWSFNFSSSSESNSDGGDVSVENNHVKIQGLEFTIPEGYVENESARLVGNDTDQDAFPGFKISAVQFDKDNDSIIIKVVYGDDELNASSYTPANDTVAEKINDIDGYFKEYDDGVSFNYIKDGKLVELFAPNKETLISLFK
ncbi:hypothetical protein TL18_02780 [Methanobrevibacter sp. YE315]|uniref:hypothetical protein n=1 Tax=Methanobrevibacter sp. YE315 TaxID=1609968 RepID=UPI000764D803|nr:hypothetical protein [Methanobrevibacter sp. YE315]AMD17041.1 hypothetical protein TL18_02780 [Methanobrevibacter sp. YE315]